MIGLYSVKGPYVTGKFSLEVGEAVIVDDNFAQPRLDSGVLERLPDDVTAHLLSNGVEPYATFSFVTQDEAEVLEAETTNDEAETPKVEASEGDAATVEPEAVTGRGRRANKS